MRDLCVKWFSQIYQDWLKKKFRSLQAERRYASPSGVFYFGDKDGFSEEELSDGTHILVSRDYYVEWIRQYWRVLATYRKRTIGFANDPEWTIRFRFWLTDEGMLCIYGLQKLIDYYNEEYPRAPSPAPPPTPWKPRRPSNDDFDRPNGGVLPVPIIFKNYRHWIGYDSPDLRRPFRRAAHAPDKVNAEAK